MVQAWNLTKEYGLDIQLADGSDSELENNFPTFFYSCTLSKDLEGITTNNNVVKCGKKESRCTD